VGSDPLGYLTQHKVVVGARQLKKALISGKARLVCLAENADPALTGPIQVLCQQNSVACAWVPSMADLGRACGIDVGAAAAAAVD
jgi:large subunit ribosomal protein L7A